MEVRTILRRGHPVLWHLRLVNLSIAYVVEIDRHIGFTKLVGPPPKRARQRHAGRKLTDDGWRHNALKPRLRQMQSCLSLDCYSVFVRGAGFAPAGLDGALDFAASGNFPAVSITCSAK